MGVIDKILGKTTENIINSGAKIIDNLVTTDKEKLQAKKELTEVVLKSLNELGNAQKEVLLAETNGNSLQRNWRPSVMIAFAFIVVYAYFIEPAFFNNEHPIAETLPVRFWDLLEIGLGGYVIGRSVEKVASTVTKNVDMSFLKKKNRNKNNNDV